MKHAIEVIALAALLAAVPCAAPADPSPAAPPRQIDSTFRSDILDEDVAVSVYLPAGYAGCERRYPVLYVLEHDLYFRFMTGVVETFARLGKMPETIVVGVGSHDRWRDMTPTHADIPDGTPCPESGGGADYRAFVTDELMPHVDGTYRTHPHTIVCGHSLAGLLAIDAMFAEGSPFDACIATSPSLWWDGEVVTERVRREMRRDPGRPRSIHLAIGGEGETLQGPVDRLRDLLAADAPPDLRWSYRHHEDADHQEMPVAAFAPALEALFAEWRLPPEVMSAGIDSVAARYETLSARWGYHLPVPESVANRLGYMALRAGDPGAAIEIFRRNVREYPDSPNVHDSLGEALAASGDVAGARRSYEKVLELDPGNANATAKLEELSR